MTDNAGLPAVLTDSPETIFIEEYARTNDPVLACVRAGITDPQYPMTVVAQRMLQRPDIQAGVEAIRRALGRHAPGVEITRESIIGDLQYVYEDAARSGDRQAAIAAKKLQAEMLGLRVDRKQIDHTYRSVKDMPMDKLLEIARGGVTDVDFEEVVE